MACQHGEKAAKENEEIVQLAIYYKKKLTNRNIMLAAPLLNPTADNATRYYLAHQRLQQNAKEKGVPIINTEIEMGLQRSGEELNGDLILQLLKHVVQQALEAHCGNRPSELHPKMKPSSRKYQARRKLSHKGRYYEKDLISNNKMNHKMVILADYSIKRLILEEQNSPLYKIFPTEVSLLITSHSNMTRRYRLDIIKKLIEKTSELDTIIIVPGKALL